MNFEQMMIIEAQRLYDTEQQLMQGMGMMSDMAQSPELKQAFQRHQMETQGQIQRLEQLCQQLGCSPTGEQSMVARALVQEAQQTLGGQQPSPVTDAMIIGAAQKGEHLEIACYGTARTLAMQMGNQQAAQLLEQTLQEEKRADEMLTQIAESGVNQQAVQQGGRAQMM